MRAHAIPASDPIDYEEFHERSHALFAVQHSRSWAELFEHANVALSQNRSAWGDEFQQCWAALGIWQRCAFVVASGPRIEMGRVSTDPDAPAFSASVSGLDVERDSFLSAKAIAVALLGALPPVPRDDEGKLIEHQPYPLRTAMQSAQRDIETILRSLRASQMTDPLHPTALPTPKGDAINLLIGTSSWAAMDAPERLDAQAGPDLGWADLWREGAMELNKPGRSERIDRAEAELAWSEALRSGRLAYVASGPTGGARQAAREARNFAKACHLFGSELLRLGIDEVGLGGLGVSLNASPVGDFGNAAFEPTRFDMVFKAPFTDTSLHHEWTHALDRMTKLSGDEVALSALARLEAAIERLDPDLSARAFDLLAARSRVNVLRARLIRTELAFARHGCLGPWASRQEVHALARLCVNDLWERALDRDITGAVDQACLALGSRIMPGGAPINRSFVSKTMRSIRNARAEIASLEQSSSLNRSAFMAIAIASADAVGLDPLSYWADPAELLARAGQSCFSHLLSCDQATPEGRIILGGSVQTSHPIGFERAQIVPLMGAWIQSCATMARSAIVARRAKNTSTPPSGFLPQMAAMGRSWARKLGDHSERDSIVPHFGISTPSVPIFDTAPQSSHVQNSGLMVQTCEADHFSQSMEPLANAPASPVPAPFAQAMSDTDRFDPNVGLSPILRIIANSRHCRL